MYIIRMYCLRVKCRLCIDNVYLQKVSCFPYKGELFRLIFKAAQSHSEGSLTEKMQYTFVHVVVTSKISQCLVRFAWLLKENTLKLHKGS
jgi:hypothetical protein